MSENPKKSVGQDIIEGLRVLRDAVRSGQKLRKKFTIRTVELDLEELAPKQYSAEHVRDTRRSLNVSQAVFAAMLAVSKEAVESWEQGCRDVPSSTRRLLDLMNADPAQWLELLGRSVREESTSA